MRDLEIPFKLCADSGSLLKAVRRLKASASDVRVWHDCTTASNIDYLRRVSAEVQLQSQIVMKRSYKHSRRTSTRRPRTKSNA